MESRFVLTRGAKYALDHHLRRAKSAVKHGGKAPVFYLESQDNHFASGLYRYVSHVGPGLGKRGCGVAQFLNLDGKLVSIEWKLGTISVGRLNKKKETYVCKDIVLWKEPQSAKSSTKTTSDSVTNSAEMNFVERMQKSLNRMVSSYEKLKSFERLVEEGG